MVRNLQYIKEQIRKQVKMSTLVEHLTHSKLNQDKMLCPLHHEKTPSFYVDDTKGVFYCHGCGAGGDIFNFVQIYNNLSFVDAVKFIDQEFCLNLFDVDISCTYSWWRKQKKQALEREKAEKLKEEKEHKLNELIDEFRALTRAVKNPTFKDIAFSTEEGVYILERLADVTCKISYLEAEINES